MIDNNDLIEIINNSEWLLEGLDKDFWRLIKLSEPEIWENSEDSENEYLWVVAIMGSKCIFYDEAFQSFNIAEYETWGEVKENQSNNTKLHDLISEIVSSRFKIS